MAYSLFSFTVDSIEEMSHLHGRSFFSFQLLALYVLSFSDIWIVNRLIQTYPATPQLFNGSHGLQISHIYKLIRLGLMIF